MAIAITACSTPLDPVDPVIIPPPPVVPPVFGFYEWTYWHRIHVDTNSSTELIRKFITYRNPDSVSTARFEILEDGTFIFHPGTFWIDVTADDGESATYDKFAGAAITFGELPKPPPVRSFWRVIAGQPKWSSDNGAIFPPSLYLFQHADPSAPPLYEIGLIPLSQFQGGPLNGFLNHVNGDYDALSFRLRCDSIGCL